MKKTFLLLLIFISFCSAAAQSTDGPVKGQIVFIPPQYYAGDFVDVLIPLPESSPDIAIDMTPDPWLEIVSWNQDNTDTGSLLTIRFISYYPGVKSLPEITVGSRVLRDIKINTRLLSEGQSLKPMKEQVLLPSTLLSLALILALIILLPLGLWFLYRGGKWFFYRSLNRYRHWKPLRTFNRDCKKIRRNDEGRELKELYYQITELVRIYLGARVYEPCLSAVTGEMETLLGPLLSETSVRELVQLFEQADRIKFAGVICSTEEWTGFAEQIQVLVKTIEREVVPNAVI